MLNVTARLAPFYTAVIAYLSLSDSKVPAVDINNIDKLYHSVAYFVMAVLWYLFFYIRFLKNFPDLKFTLWSVLKQWEKTVALGAGIISFLAGAFFELGQGYIAVNRTMDLYDMIANTCGIIIALIVLWLFAKKIS